MNRAAFFDSVRGSLFRPLKQPQVDGLNIILDEWERRDLSDLRWLAYILATAYHETAHTIQPIEEYGRGRGRAYGRNDPETGHAYFGRGYVQLTWKRNYAKAGREIGADLVNHPEKAMEPDIAAAILIEGMVDGWFTTKKLSDYFNDKSDWINARRIVNGTDRANLIAGHAWKFHDALKAAHQDAATA